MNLHRHIVRLVPLRAPLVRAALASACLAAGSAQAQWATVNTISNPPGAFTITCTDFPVPGSQQICAVSPPLPVGSTVRGNCGGSVRMVDDPAQPNTWLYQVGPRPANPPTATCDFIVNAPSVPPTGATAVPTLGEWALILLALAAATLGAGALRRKSY